jgi:hypothetical protein
VLDAEVFDRGAVFERDVGVQGTQDADGELIGEDSAVWLAKIVRYK